MPPFLSQLIIYPIKSLAGIHVNHWPVNEKGLRYDRKWMLIDSDNKFLSQRRLPKMALIKTHLVDTTLILSAPEMDAIQLSLKDTTEGEPVITHIWHDDCLARCVSTELDQWFTTFLKQPCRLVYQPDSVNRIVDLTYATPTDKVNFSDGFPFLILSEASLKSLNEAMQLEVTMARFRPNLVIANCKAYAEDYWREIMIGEINFRLPKPCSRCSVPAINPNNAEITKEPLTTLNRLRKWQHKIFFGQNALHDQQGLLNINDPLIIHLSGKSQPPLI
ncbi:MAG: MOSC domain-containing protein [Methylococcales bacterium]|nr:MOSC domain-containing protein [Methylococcales bacterium]